MSSTIDITVSGIPDGARNVVLNKADGTPVINESATFTGEKATINLPATAAGEKLKGYAHDGLATILRATYLEGITEGVVATLDKYDNIIGVGDSIMQGEFKLTDMLETPYRGISFTSAAVYGTTLEVILDTISSFTDLAIAGKRNLFVVRAGINDVNTYMSAGGLQDGSAGDVLSYSDLTQGQKDTAEQQYRDIVAALSLHGDVALASLTWADAKGVLLPLADKGASKHTGSWNDNLLNPLCQELTPDFYDAATGRPRLDYYTATINAPSSIDDDNLHFYDDYKYPSTSFNSPGKEGTWTVRKVMLDELERIGTLPSVSYDSNTFKDRVLVNFGNAGSFADKVPFSEYTNNFTAAQGSTSADLRSENNATASSTGYSISSTSSHNPTFRSNLTHHLMQWHEGVASGRIANSCMSVQKSRTLDFEVNGVEAGELSFLCRFEAEGVVGDYVTAVTITDDNGTVTHTIDNADVENTSTGAVDAMKTVPYDATNAGKVVFSLEAVGASTHGGICGVNFNINK